MTETINGHHPVDDPIEIKPLGFDPVTPPTSPDAPPDVVPEQAPQPAAEVVVEDEQHDPQQDQPPADEDGTRRYFHRIRTVAGHRHTRTVVRQGAYVARGVAVTARQRRDARSTVRHDRMMAAAEAVGDHTMVAEWDARKSKHIADRHTRRMQLLAAPVHAAKGAAYGTATALGALLVIGICLAAAERDPQQVVVPFTDAADVVKFVITAVSLLWAPAVVAGMFAGIAALWNTGRKRADEDAQWLVTSAEGEDLVIDERTITLAVKALRIQGVSDYLKKGLPLQYLVPAREDGRGTYASLRLPHGVSAEKVAKRRTDLATGLHRAAKEVFPTVGGEAGILNLWIADKGRLEEGAGPYPLLTDGKADFFKGFPLGRTLRGDLISAPVAGRNTIVGGMPGQGKALALDTPVPTPHGWSTMGDLVEGDTVFDENGQPCTVTDAWPVRNGRPCYEVEFSDGTVIVADAEHQWFVETEASRRSASAAARPKHPESPFSRDRSAQRLLPKVLTTAEMAESVTLLRSGYIYRNYSIPVAGALQVPDAELPIGPYTLGAWLGDGTTTSGAITNPDPEVVAEIIAEGEQVHQLPCTQGRCPTWRVDGLTTRLKRLGVFGDKHIPAEYLRASEAQRRALLAGLLDTDGYCQKTGNAQFAVTCERLARDVMHLVATLGYRPAFTSKPARLNGKDCGTAWIVTFTTPDKVFRLPRKAARQVTTTRATTGRRYITAIRPTQSVPVRCIAVDSPNSLFLVGKTCIPTHNSSAARALMAGAALDPSCELRIWVPDANFDFEAFKARCSRYVMGAEDELIELIREDCELLHEEIQARGRLLVQYEEPEVTRKLADREPRLRPLMTLLEEAHIAFNHAKHGKDIAQLTIENVRLGRKRAVHQIVSTQAPTKDSIPRDVTRNCSNGLAFAVGDHVANDALLGQGAYRGGHRATELLPGVDRGVCLAKGITGERSDLIQVHFISITRDRDEITPLMQRAVKAANTLVFTEPERLEKRDLLADLDEVLGTEATPIADVPRRLRELAPAWQPYVKLTGTALVKQLAEHGIKVPSTGNKWPIDPAAVRRALAERSENDK